MNENQENLIIGRRESVGTVEPIPYGKPLSDTAVPIPTTGSWIAG